MPDRKEVMGMEIGFNGADEIGIYFYGQLIARIGPNEEMVKPGVSIQYLSHQRAMNELLKKGHQNDDPLDN